MGDLKRYGLMVEDSWLSDDGEWVRFEDVQKLIDLMRECQEEGDLFNELYERINDAIGRKK